MKTGTFVISATQSNFYYQAYRLGTSKRRHDTRFFTQLVLVVTQLDSSSQYMEFRDSINPVHPVHMVDLE